MLGGPLKCNGTPRCFGVPALVHLQREGAGDGAGVQRRPVWGLAVARRGRCCWGRGLRARLGYGDTRQGCLGWLLSASRKVFHPKRPWEQRLGKADKRYSETSASLNSAAPRSVPGMLLSLVIPPCPYPTRAGRCSGVTAMPGCFFPLGFAPAFPRHTAFSNGAGMGRSRSPSRGSYPQLSLSCS